MSAIVAGAACGRGAQHHQPRPLAPCPSIPTAGLRLWLRADAGLDTEGARRVRAWLDQAPEHNDFAQPVSDKRPVWDVSGGRTVVRFAAPEASLANATLTGPMTELTVAAVLAANDLQTSSDYLIAGDGSQFAFQRTSGGTIAVGTAPAARIEVKDAMTQYERQRYVFLDHGGTASLFLGGRQMATRPSAPSAPWSGLRIGGTDAKNGLRGDVAELLVYRRALTADELAQIDRYLQAKYRELPGCVCAPGRGPHPERRAAGAK